MSKAEEQGLLRLADSSSFNPNYPNKASTSMYFGKLNLIVCTNDEQYRAWREGTIELVHKYRKAPSTREEAIAVFKRHFKEAGLE